MEKYQTSLDTFHICSMIHGLIEGMAIRSNCNLHEKRFKLQGKIEALFTNSYVQ